MNSHRIHIAHSRIGSAHWPVPLTASGATVTRPSCLPSPANQLILGYSCSNCPIERLPRRAPGSSQLGSSILLDSSTETLGNGFRVSSSHLPDRAEDSPFRSFSPFRTTVSIRTFPGGKVPCGSLSLIFPPFLRESGSLRKDSTFSQPQ